MITAETETVTIQAAAEPKAATKATDAPRKPRVAPSKAKSGKRTSAGKKAAKTAKPAKKARKPKSAGAREGSKTGKVLDLLKRSGEVTLKDLMKATDWQAHNVRGFLSGTIRKKMGLTVTSTKGANGERTYPIES